MIASVDIKEPWISIFPVQCKRKSNLKKYPWWDKKQLCGFYLQVKVSLRVVAQAQQLHQAEVGRCRRQPHRTAHTGLTSETWMPRAPGNARVGATQQTQPKRGAPVTDPSLSTAGTLRTSHCPRAKTAPKQSRPKTAVPGEAEPVAWPAPSQIWISEPQK